MTERQLLQTFMRDVQDISGLFIHKIGDTYGGHKKPADCFGTFKGTGFLIEAKKEKGTLTKYQKECLQKNIDAGGISLIFTFIKRGNSERTIWVNPYDSGKPFYIFYIQGKYLVNENTFNTIFLSL